MEMIEVIHKKCGTFNGFWIAEDIPPRKEFLDEMFAITKITGELPECSHCKILVSAAELELRERGNDS